MADLLQIGGITEVMHERLDAVFSIHKLSNEDYPGEKITHVATNGHDGVPAEVMARLPSLQMISCYGVGYDAIDVEAAKARGIVVTHTPNVLNAEVATTALMLMMACYRELFTRRGVGEIRRLGDEGKRASHPVRRQPDRWHTGAGTHWSGYCRQTCAF